LAAALDLPRGQVGQRPKEFRSTADGVVAVLRFKREP